MKKKPYSRLAFISLSIVFSFILVLWGCDKKEEKKATNHLPSEITVTSIENSHPAVKDIIGKRLDGNVTIYPLSSGEIIITMKGKNESVPVNKFIVQTEKTASFNPEIIKIQQAEIIYLFDLLLLNNLDNNELIAYTVNSPSYTETYNAVPEKCRSKIRNSITGFGLGFNKGIWENLNENISLENSVHNLLHGFSNQTEDQGGNSCTSGGAGSTSCSISGCYNESCSVSCSTGYYACCYCDDVPPESGPSCTCRKNSGPE